MSKNNCTFAADYAHAHMIEHLHAHILSGMKKEIHMNINNMTQYLVRTGILVLLLAVVCPIQARYSAGLGGDNYHFAYLSTTAGYTMLSSSTPEGSIQGAWGGNIGAGYEFRNSGFWTSVGVQASHHRSGITLNEYRYDAKGFATNGDPVTLHYDVQQQDEHSWFALDIPVMFGYYKYGFYLGAGAKIGYYINPKTRSVGSYELSATHDQTNVTFSNMPNHGYTVYDYDYTHSASLKPQVALIGEIGYDVLSSVPSRSAVCHILKLGFYFEYGLNNLTGHSAKVEAVVPDGNNATKADITPYLSASTTQGYRTVPFLTGVRLTYAIGGSRTAHRGMLHHGCMCYQ